MKRIGLIILIAVIFISCQTAPVQQTTENSNIQSPPSNSIEPEETQIPKFSIENLTKEKKKEFEKIMPLKARNFLENAESLTVGVRDKSFSNCAGDFE